MIYSRATEYAITALGHLGELPEGARRMARRIAEEEGLPAFFLAKTLQTLARQGLLKSAKGPTGGFALNKPASKIRLIDLIAAIDGLDDLEYGNQELPGFRPLRQSILSYLRNTTIADVAKRRKSARKKATRKKAARSRRQRG